MLKVLLVEDSDNDAELLRAKFNQEPPGSFQLTHVPRMRDAAEHLAREPADIVLLDLQLPDSRGLETIRRARDLAPDIPFVMLTGALLYSMLSRCIVRVPPIF